MVKSGHNYGLAKPKTPNVLFEICGLKCEEHNLTTLYTFPTVSHPFFFFFLAQFETANVSSHVPPFCFFALLFKSGEKQMSLTTEAALSFLDSSVNSS